MTSEVTSPKPVGGAIQLAPSRDPVAECGQRHWWTYQRRRGDCQGQGLDARAGTEGKGS